MPNLLAYFRHAGLAQPLTHKAADYLPGDLVAWDLGGGVLHIGLVGDRKAVTGVRRVIHIIGTGAREENILFRYAIIGHFRLEAGTTMKDWKTWLLLLSYAGGFMGNVAAGTPPATLVSEAELRACGHGQEREIAGPSASNPSIRLISISPADSSYVSRDSTVVAELEYSIDRFEPGMYQLNAQFETTDPHATIGGRLQEHPELQYAHGALRFCYPLHGIWSSPQVSFPLAMKFYLTKRNVDGSTQVIAQSPITHFNVADLPVTALGGAAPTADQLAMRDAVQTVSSMLEAVELQVQMCAEAFPDTKSSLMPPLEAWQKQFSKLKEKSDALYLDVIRQRFPGIAKDGVLVYLEGQHTAIRQQIASVPEAVSESNCAQMPGRLADGTFDPAQRIPEAYQRVSAQLSP